MKFSICHPTARPHAWRASFDTWMNTCSHTHEVEYILGLDKRWGFTDDIDLSNPHEIEVQYVWNNGRKCFVDSANAAAFISTGDVIVINSDDMFPTYGWDRDIAEAIAGSERSVGDDFVVHVWSDTDEADKRDLMVLPILSRARYSRLGYAVYPKYESLFVDDDFSEHARLENAVVNATHVTVEHRHPIVGKALWDAVYGWENRTASATLGRELLERRREAKFAL